MIRRRRLRIRRRRIRNDLQRCVIRLIGRIVDAAVGGGAHRRPSDGQGAEGRRRRLRLERRRRDGGERRRSQETQAARHQIPFEGGVEPARPAAGDADVQRQII